MRKGFIVFILALSSAAAHGSETIKKGVLCSWASANTDGAIRAYVDFLKGPNGSFRIINEKVSGDGYTIRGTIIEKAKCDIALDEANPKTIKSMTCKDLNGLSGVSVSKNTEGFLVTSKEGEFETTHGYQFNCRIPIDL